MKLFQITLAALVTASALLAAEITQKDIDEQNKMVKPIVPSADEQIDEWAQRFKERMGIENFGEVNGKIFYYTQEPVALPDTDPQFGTALINAYDKAMLGIYEQYGMDMYGRVFTEEMRKFFQDSSTNAAQIELPQRVDSGFFAKLLSILDKQLEVADKELDKKLIELGVDPAELKKMTPKAKKDLFKDTFIKKTVKRASGDISGIFTVQSAYASDDKGNHVVGLIAVVSPKTKQIAKDIRYRRKSLIKGKGRNISELIPSEPQALARTVGTRLAYDEKGRPTIISYGLSSYVPDRDSYINVRLKQDAIGSAIASADAQIALLVNGFLTAKETKKRGETVNRYVERELKPDAETIERTIKNIIDTTYKEAKATASMNLQGVSTVKKWRYTLPSGQKMVGAVRVWSYSTLDAVKKFKEGYKPKQSAAKKPKSARRFQESRIINDINDF